VASGIFDAYFEFKLAPWDFAGGALILTEAGGRVSDCSGNDLGTENSSILASNALVHEEFQKIVSKLAPENL
jgi:myo-inositol-1(or 4)-monophosphatase